MNLIKEESIAEIKIQRSKFIAHLLPVLSVEAAKEYTKKITKKHNKAHHNCWAYFLGDTGETNHCSDNGEPSGSAGQPIQRSLQKHELTNVIAVVTRYYGGVKLGIRGLIDAYGTITEDAINENNIIPLIKIHKYNIIFSYQNNDQILYNLEKIGVTIKNKEYLEKVTLHLEVTEKIQDNFLKFLKKNENFLQIQRCGEK